MIITRSWLHEWIDLSDITTDVLVKKLNSIGLEVDRVHKYTIPNKIIFGRVLECIKHPEADKLSVCKVDIGTSIRQIVCGAANVRAGLDVAVATIGAVMPDGLVIKPVKLRGIESEGMICSAKEIGIEDCQTGILEIDSSVGHFTLGQELCENPIFNDDLIEIELTANRGDCLSIHGIARDLGAAYDRNLKENNFEDMYEDKRVGIGRILSLSYEKDLGVNLRYKAVDLKELELPFIVQLRLAQIEEKRQSEVESLLLYVTHSSGVVLRAYNYDFFAVENEAIAKIDLIEDENKFVAVRGKETASIVGISQEDISRVDDTKTTILIEASYIPPDVISKQMAACKIDAGPTYYRTSRGSEPELNQGLGICLKLLEKYSSSAIYGGTIEISNSYENRVVTVMKKEIDEIIGATIDKAKITKILKNLGFNTSKSQGDNFVISIPRYRHDIVHKQDIVEEIVRLVGIDNIPAKPFIFKESNRLLGDYFLFKKRSIYRQKAAATGFFETVHFVFDEKKVLEEYQFSTLKEELELINPIVNTLDTLRPTLLTGLLKAAAHNANNGYSAIKLFEVGSVFSQERQESLKIAFLWSGETEKDSLLNGGKPQVIDFGTFVQKISNIIGAFELIEHTPTHKLAHTYQCASVVIDGVVAGELFKVHPEVATNYDIDTTYMCELNFNALKFALKSAHVNSKYQASYRDLSLLIPKTMSYSALKNVIEANKTKEMIRFYPVDNYTDETLGENRSLSLRFVLQSYEKTLEEEDITSAMDTILEALKTDLGIGLR
ncbi:MAG: phenylalanine--tRNA ligase subunit beta [Sulfurimonadaceae bacterium]|jgi:phenylalanyl-tRNA synthetase beta chain|nr:phenylalanine--tRNA ligase subunit beta [Sulfurimonadaceae bacterium]